MGQRVPSDNSVADSDNVLPDEYYANPWPLLAGEVNEVAGIGISHTHLDHAGGLWYFQERFEETYPDRRVPPVFVSRFGRNVIKNIIYPPESALPKMACVPWNRPQQAGSFIIRMFPVIHNTPGSMGFSIKVAGRGKEKHIVYPGDFKIMGDPKENRAFQEVMKQLRKEGVDLLLVDCTNAQEPGFTRPESEAIACIKDIMQQQVQGRLVITSFASHVKRLKAITEFAQELGFPVVVLGRSLYKNFKSYNESQRETGGREIHGWQNYVWSPDGMGGKRYPEMPDDAVILATGSQAEEGSGLMRMLNGDLPFYPDPRWDNLVVAARTVPRPENETRTKDMLQLAHVNFGNLFLGPGVSTYEEYDNATRPLCHVSGHENSEGLKSFIEDINPRAVVAIHGDKARREMMRDLVPAHISFQMVEEGDILDV